MAEAADARGVQAQQLLGDPRLDRAVDVAALVTAGAGDETLWQDVEGLSPEDLAWLMSVVPGLQAALGEPRDDHGLPFSWLDTLDWATGITSGPGEIADGAAAAAARGLGARAIRPIAGSTKEQRNTYRAALRAMRASRLEAERYGGVASRIPLSGALSPLSAPLSASTPVLHNVPVLSVFITGIGTATDIQGGMSPEGAVAKDVTSTAAGSGAAALTTAVVAGTGLAATAAAPVVLAIGVGAVVSYGTGKVIDAYGDDAVDAARHAVDGAVHLGGEGIDVGKDALGWAFG